MRLQAIHLTPETFEAIASRFDISDMYRDRISWVIFYQGDDDPLEIIPGNLAHTPEQACAIHEYVDICKAASYRAGTRNGRQQTRDQLHGLLGIDRIESAILSILDRDAQL